MDELAKRDALMADLISWIGPNLTPDPIKSSFLEERIELALIAGLNEVAPGARGQMTGRKDASFLPGWVGELKDVDVKISLPAEAEPSILIEVKVDDVDQVLWDLIKVADVPFVEGAVAGYLVVAAEMSRWDSDRDCVSLFRVRSEPKTWTTKTFFEDWPKAWEDLKKGGPARPTRAPAQIETNLIARAPVGAFPQHEIRCVRVRPLGPPSLVFADGDPV